MVSKQTKSLIMFGVIGVAGYWLYLRHKTAQDNRTTVEKVYDAGTAIKNVGTTFADIWNHIIGANPDAPVYNPAPSLSNSVGLPSGAMN